MALKKIFAGWDCVTCARWLVIAEFASLFVSTSLTSVLEILLFISVGCCWKRLRGKASLLLQQPTVIMSLVFFAVLFLGLFYGGGTLPEKVSALSGWRKLLLLPLGILLFDEIQWKNRLIWAMLSIATIYVLWSYVGLFSHSKTIVVHSHTTQGMFFSVAAFAAVVFLFSGMRPQSQTISWWLGIVAILLIANVVFVGLGRSGYLALFVLACAASFFLLYSRVRLWGMVIPVVILGLIVVSPVAMERLTQGLHDMQEDYAQTANVSDMGLRMVMWTNTLNLIKERPVFGYGLGGLKEAYQQQVEGVDGWQGVVIDDPHNQYLKVAAEHGLVGLFVFLGFVAAFFFQKVPMTYRVLGLGVLLAWCATSFFNSQFSSSASGRFILLWAGAQLAMPISDKIC